MLFVPLRLRLTGSIASTFLRRLRTHQIVVVNKVVAIVDEEIGGRLFDANADNRLVVLAQLAHQRRKIRVATYYRKGVDVAFGVTEVESIDDHADIGGILPRLPHVWDFDELERSLM